MWCRGRLRAQAIAVHGHTQVLHGRQRTKRRLCECEGPKRLFTPLDLVLICTYTSPTCSSIPMYKRLVSYGP